MKQCSSVSEGDWHPQWMDYFEHQAQSAGPLLKGRDPTNETSQTNKDSASILLQDLCTHIMKQGYRRYWWYMRIFTGVHHHSYQNITFADCCCLSQYNKIIYINNNCNKLTFICVISVGPYSNLKKETPWLSYVMRKLSRDEIISLPLDHTVAANPGLTPEPSPWILYKYSV